MGGMIKRPCKWRWTMTKRRLAGQALGAGCSVWDCFTLLLIPQETALKTQEDERISWGLGGESLDWHWWDKVSGFTFLEPGWWSVMLNHLKKSAHLAWREFRHLEEQMYSKFLWSVQTTNGCSAPTNASTPPTLTSPLATPGSLCHNSSLLGIVCGRRMHRNEALNPGWDRTVLTPESEASTSTTNWCEGSGKVRMGAVVKLSVSEGLFSRQGAQERGILGGDDTEGGCCRAVVKDGTLVEVGKHQEALQPACKRKGQANPWPPWPWWDPFGCHLRWQST